MSQGPSRKEQVARDVYLLLASCDMFLVLRYNPKPKMPIME